VGRWIASLMHVFRSHILAGLSPLHAFKSTQEVSGSVYVITKGCVTELLAVVIHVVTERSVCVSLYCQ
jgi:hypothetical protein